MNVKFAGRRRARLMTAVTMLAIILGASWVPNTTWAQGSVSATFKIDSEFFKSAYGAQIISEVELSVAQSLAAIAEEKWPFLTWLPATNEATTGPKLVLRMKDVGNGACAPTPTISLQWFGVVGSGEKPLDINELELYGTCDADIPTQEPLRLEEKIVAKVSSSLSDTSTRKNILMTVIAKVAFLDEIINHENQSLLLPVTHSELAAGTDSRMRAELKFLDEGGQSTFKNIGLRPGGKGPQDNVKVVPLEVDGAALTFSNQPIDMLNPGVVALLNQTSGVRIYMTNYFFDQLAGEEIDQPDW